VLRKACRALSKVGTQCTAVPLLPKRWLPVEHLAVVIGVGVFVETYNTSSVCSHRLRGRRTQAMC